MEETLRTIAAGFVLVCALTACQSADRGAARWQPLFDGETIADHWIRRGGDATYTVVDGAIVGVAGSPRNTFLCTRAEYCDFTLELEFRWGETACNSGVQFRSHVDHHGVVYGYQCEIDPSERGWSGGVYDEGRRAWLATLEDNPDARAALKRDGWNHLRIRAVSDHIQTWLNGVPAADFHDDADDCGFIALQVHSGAEGEIFWRNIRVRSDESTERRSDEGSE